jgi:hypothetical protein
MRAICENISSNAVLITLFYARQILK